MIEDRIKQGNQAALDRILSGQPILKGLSTAKEVIPGMDSKMVLHAGPPVPWEKMCGPMRGAVIGGLIYEDLAENEAEAVALIESGEIKFDSCHHHDAVGPMAGIITGSMPVWVIQNTTYGNYAFSTLNEGLGKVLRYGAYSPEVIDRLKWMETVLAPVLREALTLSGPIELSPLISQAILMGDEGHNRNKAGTSLFLRALAPYIVETQHSLENKGAVLRFINSNDHFFLNLTMPACKAIMDPVKGIEFSTIVYAMARNGTEFGIRVSSMGDRWFTAPAEVIDGLFFPGFSALDANPDIGDSVITETAGLGGFAMAAAPAIVQFVGGAPQEALEYTRRMYEITQGESNQYQIPILSFRGTATGIDLIKVIETGILPIINTGIAHRNPGVGQIGAGLVRPPMKCFELALEAFVESLEEKGLIE